MSAPIVPGILSVVLGANLINAVASFIHSVAEWLVTPFKALFTLKHQTIQVVVNWGSAAIVYLVLGLLIARLVRTAYPAWLGASGAGRSAIPLSKDLMPPSGSSDRRPGRACGTGVGTPRSRMRAASPLRLVRSTRGTSVACMPSTG